MKRGTRLSEAAKERIRETIEERQRWVRESATLREAIEAGNERRAMRLARELAITWKEEAA